MEASPRLRDVFVAAELDDPDEHVNPFLSRVLAAYLDQGVAYWPMPDRERGLFEAFVRLYGQAGAPPSPWRAHLRRELERKAKAGLDAEAAALDELDRLGVPAERWEELLRRTLLALPGWSGMAHQLEARPESAPVEAPPIALLDVVAIRLLLDRLAAEHLGEARLGAAGPNEVRRALLERLRVAERPHPPERALELFVLAQLAGVSAARLPAAATALLREMDAFDHLARRRVYQLAYERRFLDSVTDTVSAHVAAGLAEPVEAPKAQLVFCIRSRPTSRRRRRSPRTRTSRSYAVASSLFVAAGLGLAALGPSLRAWALPVLLFGTGRGARPCSTGRSSRRCSPPCGGRSATSRSASRRWSSRESPRAAWWGSVAAC